MSLDCRGKIIEISSADSIAPMPPFDKIEAIVLGDDGETYLIPSRSDYLKIDKDLRPSIYPGLDASGKIGQKVRFSYLEWKGFKIIGHILIDLSDIFSGSHEERDFETVNGTGRILEVSKKGSISPVPPFEEIDVKIIGDDQTIYLIPGMFDYMRIDRSLRSPLSKGFNEFGRVGYQVKFKYFEWNGFKIIKSISSEDANEIWW